MRSVIFSLLFLSLCVSVFAENDSLPITYDTVRVKFFVTDAKNNQPLKDVYALVELDRQIIFTSDTTTLKGKTSFHLHITNAVYSITICKKGYYSKIIWVHTKKIPAQRMKRAFAPIDIEISLFEKMPNINFPLLSTPVLKYYYSKYEEEFIQDFDYSVSIMKQQEAINTKITEYQVWKKDSFQSAQIIRADSFYNEAGNKIIKTWANYDTLLFIAAIKDYYSAIKTKPDFWQAYVGKASIHIYLKQYNQAIIDLTAAIKYAGADVNSYLFHLRGEALYYSGQYENAIKDFDVSIEKGKGTKEKSLLLRAKTKWKLGKYDEACVDYKQAIEINKSLEEQKEFLECK